MAQGAAAPFWPSSPGEMAQRIREHDWAGTPLGPVEDWPERLRTMVDAILGMPSPAVLHWGPQHVQLYNDAFVAIARERHPRLLGQPAAVGWADVFAEVGTLLSTVRSGQAVQLRNYQSVIDGPAGPEPRVFDADWSPLRDGSGEVSGVLQTLVEVTERRRAEAVLRVGEERLQVALAASDLGAWVWHVAEDRTEADARALAHFGLPPGGKSTLAEALATVIHPEDGPRYAAAVACATDPTGPGRLDEEFRIQRPDGQERWLSVRATTTFEGTPPTAVRMTGVLGDVTDRKRAEAALQASEERQAFLLKLSDALRPLVDPADIQTAATRVLGEHLRANRVAYVQVTDEDYVIERDYVNGVPSMAGRHCIRSFGPGKIADYREGRPRVVRDTRTDAHNDAEAAASFAAIGVRAGVGVPLIKEGHFVANLVVHMSEPRHWTAEDVVLVEETAERTWAALERARAEAALRESEARLAAAFESVPVGLAVMDVFGRAVLSNTEFHRFLPTGVIPSRDPGRVGRWRAWDAEGRPLDPEDFPGARALRGEQVVPGLEMLHTDEEGREVWTSVSTAPIRDEAGRVTGLVTVVHDIDAAKRSADALREREEQLRSFGEASSDVLWIRDAETLEWLYLSPAFERIYGLSREEALLGDTFRNWLNLVVPEDREHAYAMIARARAGERVTFEYRITRPSDGTRRTLRNTDFPIHDAHGRVTRIGGVGHDATEERAIAAALAASEQRLRSLTEGIPQLVWTAVDGGHWTWASPQWTAYTGLSEVQSTGLGWLAALHPDDRHPTMAVWKTAVERGGFEAEYRLRHTATGGAGRAADGPDAFRWFQTRAAPVRDEAGRIVEWLGTSTDVQDLREMQERQGVLVGELQHRTRNLMIVVLGMMRRTRKGSGDLDRFAHDFQSRLEALARVNSLLSRLHEGERITFDELIRTELQGMGALDAQSWGPQVTLKGPKGVRLRSATVQTLALALHELATNASKYGALAQPNGRLEVRWRCLRDGHEPRLRVEWIERGVAMPPPGAAPQGSGYGRELIERALPYQLEAETTFEMGADGVRCTIALPLSSTEASHA